MFDDSTQSARPNRRTFLKLGLASLAVMGSNVPRAFANGAKTMTGDEVIGVSDTSRDWTLGQYKAKSEITYRDQLYFMWGKDAFLAALPIFQTELENAKGKTDSYSQRLNAYSQMIAIAKTMDDPYMQAAAIKHYVRDAVKSTPRRLPNNLVKYDGDIDQLEAGANRPESRNWALPFHILIGSGEGVCIEQANAVVMALRQIHGKADAAYLMTGSVDKHAHAWALILTAPTEIVVDTTQDALMTASDYVSKPVGKDGFSMEPQAIYDEKGNILVLYEGEKSKEIKLEKTPKIQFTPDKHDTDHNKAAYDAIVALGEQVKKIKGHDLPRPAPKRTAEGLEF